MKTLLIYPPTVAILINQAGELKRDPPSLPLGIAYLAAALEKANCEVRAIDMFDFTQDQVVEAIERENPDIVGISCFTERRHSAFEVARIAKEINPNIKVVMGGSHATFLYEQVLLNYPIDIIVLGEGESTLADLVKCLESDKDISELSGIAFEKDGRVIKTNPRPYITNLDELPFPSYHHFNLNRYKYFRYDFPNSSLNGKKISELNQGFMITSHGCPYACQFCSTTIFWGRKLRLRSPQNVVDEIEQLYNRYDIRFIMFQDDIFTVNQKRVIEICKEIKRRGPNIRWVCGTRVDCLSEEMLKHMREAGCFYIALGAESFSQPILDNMNKRTKVPEMVRAINMIYESGISVGIDLIVGYPGESNKTIDETIKTMDKLRLYGLGTNLITVYPATPLYELAKRQGFIEDDYWLTEKACPIYTVDNGVETLKKWQNKIQLHYYFKKRMFRALMFTLLQSHRFTKLLLEFVAQRYKHIKGRGKSR